jgi:hypothetical protein
MALLKFERTPDCKTEADFLKAAKALFRGRGWRVHHSAARPARQGRYVTTGDPGFPDLLCMRPPMIIFLELKHVGASKARKDAEAQRLWINGLQACGVHAYVVDEGAWPMLVDIARDGAAFFEEEQAS